MVVVLLLLLVGVVGWGMLVVLLLLLLLLLLPLSWMPCWLNRPVFPLMLVLQRCCWASQGRRA